jgi:hypothetical protein
VMLELEVSQDDHGIGVRIAKFSKCPNLFRTEFQRPSQLPKVITPEPLIVRGRVKNCWKTKEVSYEFPIGGFWRWCWILSQKSRFLRLFNSVNTETQQPDRRSKTHNSYTTNRTRA